MTRRVHNFVEKLPFALREVITQMLVDNIWPNDFKPEAGYKGNPRYIDIVLYCRQKGFEVSDSAISRWSIHLRVISRMKEAGLIARDVMKDLTEEKASATQKAAAEMITAHIVQLAAEEESLTTKQLKEVSQAVRDCMNVSITADKYIREQLAKKIRTATESTKAKLTKAGVNRKLIQEIIDEHLGVVKA
jgi:hypothetical protein